jgi:hypothetical protein
MSHLTPEQLVDIVEGARPQSSVPHLASCEGCQRTLADLRIMRSAIAEGPVPEPSPLFWDHLSARIREAVESESRPTSWWARWWSLPRPAMWVGGAVAAALTIVLVARFDRSSAIIVNAPGVDGSLSVKIEPLGVADDPSLAMVADLAGDLDWESASEAGFTLHVGVDNDAVTQLTDRERYELSQLLKGELSRRGA